MTDEIKPARKPRTTKKPAAKKKTRGNPDLLPFEEAREYIRTEMIESRRNFETWWQRTQPKTIPRFPYRAYEKKGWISWNDFLGVNNQFVGKKIAKWRQFDDAVKWAHSLRIETQVQWSEFAKSADKPEDIPQRPDIVYQKWVSWNHWLGNKPSERIKVAEENQGIFYVIQEEGVPTNVLTFGVEPGGLHAMKARWDRSPYRIIKFFKNSRDKTEQISKIINTLTSEYMGSTKQRVAPNVWEVIWYLQLEMEIISNYAVEQAPRQQFANGLMPVK